MFIATELHRRTPRYVYHPIRDVDPVASQLIASIDRTVPCMLRWFKTDDLNSASPLSVDQRRDQTFEGVMSPRTKPYNSNAIRP